MNFPGISPRLQAGFPGKAATCPFSTILSQVLPFSQTNTGGQTIGKCGFVDLSPTSDGIFCKEDKKEKSHRRGVSFPELLCDVCSPDVGTRWWESLRAARLQHKAKSSGGLPQHQDAASHCCRAGSQPHLCCSSLPCLQPMRVGGAQCLIPCISLFYVHQNHK